MGLDIRTVLFDLDGTIYQNLTFNRIYIRNLTAGTPLASWQESLLAYTEEVFAGRRLIMNRAYSTLPLPAPDPESYFAALEGALLPDLSYEELLQQEHCLFLGDAWAVLALLGKTLGLLEGSRLDAVYRMSRRDMSQEGMEGDKKLRDAIIRLGKRCETVLVSNSYEDTAWDFLCQLGYDGIFSRCCFSAGKPGGLEKALNDMEPGILQEPRRLLTIGDHAFNDLFPLARLGARTLWVNPYPAIHKPPCDGEVATTGELADYLDRL